MKWMTQLMALSVAFVLSDGMVYMVLKWKVTFQFYVSILKIEYGFKNIKCCVIPTLK